MTLSRGGTTKLAPMRGKRLRSGGVAVIAAVCLLLSAGGAGGAGPQLLRGSFGSFPDYMDPQLSYTAEGWTAMYDVYIPLLTYRHANGEAGSEVIPGLARSLPRISRDGRTYTLFLRKGLRYSNGRPVQASDFEYAVKRMFRLGSGGYPFYLGIVGAWRYLRHESRGISGIVSDDGTGKIVIHLERPQSSFTQLLALMFVAPVPQGTPMQDLSLQPPPATGPYAITSSEPGLGWSYARNPAWLPDNANLMPQLPSGHFSEIKIDVLHNALTQVREVERGELDWMQNPAPSSLIGSLKKRFGGSQFRIDPTLSTYYFWMNTTRPPFDDVRVRRAVNYAIDRRALARIYSGQISPGQQILPPGMPGYRKLDLYPFTVARAKAMIKAAHPTDRNITVWTDTESPNDEAAEYYVGVLRDLGFKTHLKVVNADNYFTVIGNAATPNLDTGWSDWFEDFPHPNDFFQPMLDGTSILPVNNGNFARIDVPSLNRKIARLARRRGPIPAAQYAALDRSYTKLAPWAPYGTRTLTTFVSKRIDLSKVVFNSSFFADLASFQLR